MADAPKLIVFAGSARKDSMNKKLARVMADEATKAGAEVTLLDMAEHRLPLYDGDLDAAEGLSSEARALKQMIAGSDGLIIASPEYNGSVSPMLKNVIDWVTRAAGDAAPMMATKDKVAGIVSASPSSLGGLRGLVHLRQILTNVGCVVVPQQHAMKGFGLGEDGSVEDDGDRAKLAAVAAATVRLARGMRAS